jgi:hypothetical protein
MPIAEDYKNVLLAMVLWQRNPWIKHYDKTPSRPLTTNKTECQSMHSIHRKMCFTVTNQQLFQFNYSTQTLLSFTSNNATQLNHPCKNITFLKSFNCHEGYLSGC